VDDLETAIVLLDVLSIELQEVQNWRAQNQVEAIKKLLLVELELRRLSNV